MIARLELQVRNSTDAERARTREFRRFKGCIAFEQMNGAQRQLAGIKRCWNKIAYDVQKVSFEMRSISVLREVHQNEYRIGKADLLLVKNWTEFARGDTIITANSNLKGGVGQ